MWSKNNQILVHTENMEQMRTHSTKSLVSPVSEIEIVDVFTRMIFGDEDISLQELRIIQALSEVDQNVCLDSFAEIGTYLRALGVEEMIKLVTRVRFWLSEHEPGALGGVSSSHPATLRRH